MKILLIIVAILSSGCGSKDEDSAAPTPPEVSVISTPEVTVYSSSNEATAAFSFTTTGVTDGYTAIAALKVGTEAPADCKTADVIATSNKPSFYLTSLKPSTSYGMRVCMVNSASGVQSTGSVIKFVIPAE